MSMPTPFAPVPFAPAPYVPPGAPLPNTAPMPAAFSTTPSWGVNPYTPSALAPGGVGPVGSTATVINTLGQPVPAPGTTDPAQLASDIESGLAKLDTVNPQLAQQLREKHGLTPDQGEGGLLGFLGDIGGAIAKGASGVMDLLGRSAHLVPALVDPESWKDDNPLNNAWDALMGRDTTNWNEVLQHMGWAGDGAVGWLRAGVGFAGDVLTDPLTYATFGAGAGASVAEKGTLAGEKVVAATFGERAAALGLGQTAEEGGNVLVKTIRELAGNGAKVGTEDAAQALAATAGRAIDGGYRSLLQDSFETYDNVYNRVYARTFSRWTKSGELMKLSSGTTVNPSDVRTILEDAVQKGIGTSPKSAEWLSARASAGALGGARFSPFIPFTQFRYISPILPGSDAIQPLGRVARFMAGKGWSSAASKLVDGGEMSWDEFSTLMQKGVGALRQSSDPNARRVFEKLTAHGRGSSAFYSASERMGGLTANFAKGSKLNRTGLGGYWWAQQQKALRGNVDHVRSEMLYNVVEGEGKTSGLSGQDYVYRVLKDTWGITDDSGSSESFDTVRNYMELFGGLSDVPSTAADVQSGAFDQWFWNRGDVRAKLSPDGLPPEPGVEADLRNQLDQMKAVLAEVPEGPKRQSVDALAAVERRGRDVQNQYGAHVADARIPNLDSVKEMAPEDVHLFNGNAPKDVKGDWYIVPQNRHLGITDQDVVGHGDLGIGGVRVSRSGDAAGAQTVAINPRRILVVDPGDTATSTILHDGPLLQEAKDRAEAQMEALKQQMDEAGVEVMPNSPMHPDNWDATVANLVTQDLKARGGLDYDAVYFRGSDEMVLLGTDQVDPWNMVKAVNESAPRVRPVRGYFHRTFNKEAEEFLHGVRVGDAPVFAVRDLAAKARRAAHGLDYDQAEAKARQVIIEQLQAKGAGEDVLARVREMPLFERNPLKAHQDYINNVAETVVGGMSAETAERFNTLGELLPERFGRYADIDTSTYSVDTQLLKAVQAASPKTAEAQRKYLAAVRKHSQAMAKSADDDYDRLAALLDAWRAGEQVDLSALQFSNPKLARVIEAADDKGRVIHQHITRLEGVRSNLESRLATTQAVEDMLAKDGTFARDLNDLIDPQRHLTWADMPEGSNVPPNITEPGVEDPLVVYHGTGQVYETPETGRASKGAGRSSGAGGDLYGPEHYVTTDPEVAGLYTPSPEEGVTPNVRRGVLRLDKGSVFFAEEELSPETAKRLLDGLAGVDKSTWEPGAYTRLETQLRNTINRDAAKEAGAVVPERALTGEAVWNTLAEGAGNRSRANDFLESLGYEAVHYHGGAHMTGDYTHEAFAVFNPDKSIVHYGNWREVAQAEHRIIRDDLEELLARGELGVGADGSVVTRAGRARLAGKGGARKVYPLTATQEELHKVLGQLSDLHIADRVRSGEDLFGAEASALPKGVASKQAQLEQAVASLGTDVRRGSQARADEAAKNARRVLRTEDQAKRSLGELNDMVATSEGIQAPLKPAVVFGEGSMAGARTGMTQVNVPGLDNVWVHEYVAEELNTLVRHKPVGALRDAWREFVLTPWKKWATYRSPGFHVRNAFGAWFNNALGGVSSADYHFAQRVMLARDGYKEAASKLLSPEDFQRLGLHLNANFDGALGKMTYGDIASMMADQGMGRANATTVALVEQTAKEGSMLKAQAGHVVKGARAADSALRRTGALTEDYFRTAAWAAGMRATSGDMYGARAFVMVRHGDYADLTQTEEFVKDLVPFYKWMRTNVPYQFRMLAEEPGKLLMLQKAQQEAFQAMGLDPNDYGRNMPDWMKKGLTIPIPFTGGDDGPSFLTLDLPASDLFKGGREYLGSFLPLVSDVVESTVLKQDIFTGRGLTGKMVPLSGVFNVPGVRELVAALPGATRGADGSVYIPDTFDNIMSGLPIFGRFRNFLTADPSRVEKRFSSFASFAFGVGVAPIDLTADEKAFFYDELQPTLDMYSSLGYVFPTKDQLVAAGRLAATPTGADPNAWWPSGLVGQLPSPAGPIAAAAA